MLTRRMASRKRDLVVAALTSGLTLVVLLMLMQLSTASSEYRASTKSIGSSIQGDVLEAPTDLSISGGGPFTLSWTSGGESYLSGHRLYRSTVAGGPYSLVGEVSPADQASTIDSPPTGSYFYVVRAFYGAWDSLDSNEIASPPVP